MRYDWHPPVAADGTGRWIGGLDDRLFEALLPAEKDERQATPEQAQRIFAARSDQLEGLVADPDAPPIDALLPFIASRSTTFRAML